MSQPFQLRLRVRYAECDAQGIVFNARYGDYVDTAATEYIRALFGSYQDLLDRGYDQHVVRLETNWYAPARFDDVLAIAVTTSKLGNTSYQLSLQFRNESTGAAVADSVVTYVMIDVTTGAKIAIPDMVRGRLESGASGVVVDQVGAV